MRAINILLSIFIFVFVLLNCVGYYTFNEEFYYKEYAKYKVYQDVKYNKEDVKGITINIIKYLKNEVKSLNYKNAFKNKEIIHMKDVKKLFSFGFYLKYIIGLLIVIIIAVTLKNHSKLYSVGGYLLIINVLFLIISVAVSLNYDSAFTVFHKLMFNNDYWLLDPKESVIINLLPLNFFIDISVKILILNTGINAFITLTLKYFSNRYDNNRFNINV